MMIRAIADALRLDAREPPVISDWDGLLDCADKTHVTLALAGRLRDIMPPAVRARVDQNAEDSRQRFDRLREAYLRIADALTREGIDWIVLKGFTQWPGSEDDLALRPQYDLDLLCAPEDADRAQRAIVALVTSRSLEPKSSPPIICRCLSA